MFDLTKTSEIRKPLHKKLIYAGSKFQVFLIFFIMIPPFDII